MGRNIAENLARLGTRTYLIAAVGRDVPGDDLLAQAAAAGIRVEYVHRTHLPTGTYVVLLDSDREVAAAVSDMSATDELSAVHVALARSVIATAGMLVLDANPPAPTLVHALELARANGVRVVLAPVSVPKASLVEPYITAEHPLFAVTPTREELTALTGLRTRTDRQVQVAANRLHERGVRHVWVRMGERGSLLSTATDGSAAIPSASSKVVDVTGAGDAMVAGFCHAVLAWRRLGCVRWPRTRCRDVTLVVWRCERSGCTPTGRPGCWSWCGTSPCCRWTRRPPWPRAHTWSPGVASAPGTTRRTSTGR